MPVSFMPQQILDLHIHSKYSRACSKDLELPKIAAACQTRGVDIVATGDFTHHKWFEHIKESLVEVGDLGIFKLNNQDTRNKIQTITNYQLPITKFIIGTELAVIKKHKGETRRIHVNVFAPNLAVVEKFNQKLESGGFNLRSDGRPILGLTVKELLQIMLEIDERMIMIPAHAWTPWFGIFGSKGGYNSLEEAFDELAPKVFAIETGLSSDPLMNWRLSKLDNIALVSNSDAHSLEKIGREANVLQFENEKEITYDNIFKIIKEKNKNNFLYTIEFYPEEGKYHFDGHRDCKFVCAPEETKKLKGLCPKCKKPLVIGVMNRVSELADRSEEEALRLTSLAPLGLSSGRRQSKRVPYKSMVPLPEIIADALAMGVKTKAVQTEYNNLIKKFGSEFNILLKTPVAEIKTASQKIIGEAVERVRNGKIYIQPGYDGEFGVVKVFGEKEKRGGLRQTGLNL